MLHQTVVFEVRQFSGVIDIYIRPTLVAMVTKIWETRIIQAICWCHWHLHQNDPGFHGNENVKILTQN